MALTPETLTRHELIGLRVRVADAPNPDRIGIAGRIVAETMGTFVVETSEGETKQVQKRGSLCEFRLPIEAPGGATTTDTDEAAGDRKVPGSSSELGMETAGVRPRQSVPSASVRADAASPDGECEDGVYVTVDATTLLSRPAERTEVTGDSKWR